MLNKEKIQHHIKHLQDQHEEIDKKIKEEFKHYSTDNFINELKKKKLQLRDEIELNVKKLKDV